MKYGLKTWKDDRGRYTILVTVPATDHRAKYSVSFYGNSFRSAMMLVTDFICDVELQEVK